MALLEASSDITIEELRHSLSKQGLSTRSSNPFNQTVVAYPIAIRIAVSISLGVDGDTVSVIR